MRPIHHRVAKRVRAHFFICMGTCWSASPLLFVDDDKAAAQAERPSPVAPAPRSAAAKSKDARKRNAAGDPEHSFSSLLGDLATVCADRIEPAGEAPPFDVVTTPAPLQRHAFGLLGVSHLTGLAESRNARPATALVLVVTPRPSWVG
ncbi:MAG: hypothetical protein ACRD0D_04605, partial [Acidimicrobiales bacterium]